MKTRFHHLISFLCITLLLSIPVLLVYDANFAIATQNVALHKAPTGDQEAIYTAFKTAAAGQLPSGVQNGWMPVGYLALIGFYHKTSALWMQPEIFSSFVYNGVIYSLFAALISILLMFRVALDQSPSSNKVLLALGCSVFWVAMFKLSAILRFTWFPWSHYASAFVGMSFVACFYEAMMRRKVWAMFCGGFFACLFLYTRRHEAMAVFVATGLLSAIVLLPSLYARKWPVRCKSLCFYVLLSGLGVFCAIEFIHYFSFGMPLNAQYAQQRTYDSYINEYLKLYPEMVPLRLIQTFLDPNYYSFGNTYQIRKLITGAASCTNFSMPMIFQLPILWFLIPFSFFSLGYVFFKTSWWKRELEPALRMFLLGVFAFFILLIGYFSAGSWGGSQLLNGLVREFILSVLLLSIGTGPGLFLFFSHRFARGSLAWAIPMSGILLLCVAWGQFILPKHTEWFTFTNKHISREHSQFLHHCKHGTCHVDLQFVNTQGRSLHLPFDSVIINSICPTGIQGGKWGMTEAGVTVHGQAFEFKLIACNAPVDIEIYPVAMGKCSSGVPPFRFSIA